MSDEALRHVAAAEADAGRVAGLDEATARRVGRVAVIGAGTMGGGIAMAFAGADIPVTLVEREAASLERGRATMSAHWRRSVERGRLSEDDLRAREALVAGATELQAVAKVDLVVEAVLEDMALKQELFGRLGSVVRPGAVLATNTSYLDVDAIAQASGRPADVVGMHFFSPAHIMRLLEVVRGEATAPDVLATAIATGQRLGKVPVVSGVCHGFIGNRMLARRQQAAQALLLEGALPWQVDRVLTDFGFPMGPFQMSDLAGLDIGWKAEASKGETLRDRLCEAGRRGQKTGAGWYDYGPERQRHPSPVVEEMVRAYVAERGAGGTPPDRKTMLHRLLDPMIEEGRAILAEGIAQRAGDIDLVWIHGYGWPRATGGPMWWAGVREA